MPYKDREKARAAWKRYYDANPTFRTSIKEKTDQRRKQLSEWVREQKAKLICCRCGFDHPATLHFHHRDPSVKDISIAQAVHHGWSIKRIEKEILKCDILCANCHAIEHLSHLYSSPERATNVVVA